MTYCVAAFSFMRLPCGAACPVTPCGPLNLCLLKSLSLPRPAPASDASASIFLDALSVPIFKCTAARAAGSRRKKGRS